MVNGDTTTAVAISTYNYTCLNLVYKDMNKLFVALSKQINMYNSITLSIPKESKALGELVKRQVQLVDSTASVILFGSRARGDAAVDSDWDFLVLTEREDTEALADQLRKKMLREVELKYDAAISLIVKNVSVWQNNYAITNIYESIADEGIQL